MKLHPTSLLVGAAGILVVLLTLSAVQGSSSSPAMRQLLDHIGISIDGPVDVNGIRSPEQLVRIEEGIPNAAPAGEVVVLTGAIIDLLGASANCEVLIHGQPEIAGQLSGSTGSTGPATNVFFWGYRVDPGSVVSVDDDHDSALHPKAVRLGHLANAL